MTRYWMSPTGPSLDVAPFVAALEHASGRQAVVLGKPSREVFDAAALKLGLPAADLLMIGDDIRADVGGAQSAGLRGAMVKTGKFRPDDLRQGVQPDALLNSVADLPDWWLAVAGSDESNAYENKT
jgi:ribonucleotide monophosphatase NagD (HAD superfamily)